MKKTSKLLALALSLSMLLAGCGGPASSSSSQGSSSSDNGPKTQKDTIVFSPRLDFATMDVQNTPSIVTKSIYYLVYNTLVE